MSSENAEGPDRSTTWVVGASLAPGLALAGAAIAWSWPAQTLAGLLQVLGIALTALGVAVVRAWLELAADKAIDAQHRLERWSALRRDQLRRLWARLRKRGVAAELSFSDALGLSDALELSGHRPRVDRDTVSDREWLAYLDDRVESIFDLMDQAEQNRAAEREDLNRRLGAQRDELRAEIQRETRQGWELILTGLFLSAVGTGVGMFG